MPGITNPAEEYFKDGLWAWVTDQWKKLVADASNFLQINVAAQDIDVEVTQTAPADLTPGVCGWDGSAWHKLPLLFGYSERWSEIMGGTLGADGDYSDYSVAVPAGYIYVLQSLSILNNIGARGLARVYIYEGTNRQALAGILAPGVGVPTVFAGQVVMSQGDRVRVSQLDCLEDDVITAGARGYKMKIAE